MENRKIIVSLYLGASMVVWFLTRSCFHYLMLSFYKFRRIPGVQIGSEAVPLLLALIVFAVFMKHKHVNEVMEEVVSEIKKVTWPSRDDVMRSTYVVLVCIVIASLFLASFDLVWGKVIGFFLG